MTDVVEITDDDELYRRLAPHQISPDGRTANRSAFRLARKAYDQHISVDLKRLTESPQDTLATRPTFGLGVLNAGEVRRLGFAIRHQPLPDNPAHALIEGENSRELSEKLAQITTVIIWPK